MMTTKKPKLTVVPDLKEETAEEALASAADEAVEAKQTYEELRASNIQRIQTLQNEGFGAVVGGPLLQMRVEILIEAVVGAAGQQRDQFEMVFENRLPILLDQLEAMVKYAKAQRIAGPGAAVTEGGLIVPS
jgi:hypothetical protein